MRKKGAVCDFIEERNEELKQAFRECRRSGDYKTTDDIFGLMAKRPVSRFYINEQRARNLIADKWKKGKWSGKILRKKQEMIEEIERRVIALMTKDRTLSLDDAVVAVVFSEAPSFYMTTRSIRTTYYNEKLKTKRLHS